MAEFKPPLRKTPPCTHKEIIGHYEKQLQTQGNLDNAKLIRKSCRNLVDDHFNNSLYVNAYGELSLVGIRRFINCNQELNPYGWEISYDGERLDYYLKKK